LCEISLEVATVVFGWIGEFFFGVNLGSHTYFRGNHA
jgi:hypothetical protein